MRRIRIAVSLRLLAATFNLPEPCTFSEVGIGQKKRADGRVRGVGFQWTAQNSTHVDCLRLKFRRDLCRNSWGWACKFLELFRIAGTPLRRDSMQKSSDFKCLAAERWNSVVSCAINGAFSGNARECKCRKNGLFVELRALVEPERRAYRNGSSTRFAKRSFKCWPVGKCRFPN